MVECDSDFLTKLNLAPAYTLQIKKKLTRFHSKSLDVLSAEEVESVFRSESFHEKINWKKYASGISGLTLSHCHDVRDYLKADVSTNDRETLRTLVDVFRKEGVPTRCLVLSGVKLGDKKV
jgi:hypothetical protein